VSDSRPCECGSGAPYRDCCRPYHRGEREPSTCSLLVRARFCAFARKEIDFLWRTLDAEHPARQEPQAQVLAGMRESARILRFVRLKLFEERAQETHGQVLFLAEVFERGKERTFVELSEFRRAEGEGWRYRAGQTIPTPAGAPDVKDLSIDTFPQWRAAREATTSGSTGG
jgi:SEC-C motif domain protein